MIWCGIDWAERHHDVALVDADGKLIAKRRIGDDLSGFTALLELLTEHRAISNGECATPIAIETANGLLPAALLASGFTVYAINPLAATRWFWLTCSAPIAARIGRSQPTPNSCEPSGCSLAPSKTRSGSVNKPRTSSGRYSGSTTRPHWPASMISLPRLRGKCSLWHQPPTTHVGCAEPHSERQ
jgi:hypothetical protein